MNGALLMLMAFSTSVLGVAERRRLFFEAPLNAVASKDPDLGADISSVSPSSKSLKTEIRTLLAIVPTLPNNE